MKFFKYISILLSIFFLSSCEPSGFEMTRDYTFTIHPETVISGFQYEVNPGDITKLPEGCKLRVRIYLYDEWDGNNPKLIEKGEVLAESYYDVITYQTTAPSNGLNYIVITDVVAVSDVGLPEVWTVTNEDVRWNLKITKAGTQSAGVRDILGVAEGYVEDTKNDIYPEAAGFLLCSEVEVSAPSDITSANGTHLIINSDISNYSYSPYLHETTYSNTPLLIKEVGITNFPYSTYSYTFFLKLRGINPTYNVNFGVASRQFDLYSPSEGEYLLKANVYYGGDKYVSGDIGQISK